jgi:transposase InsO family protein
VDRFRAEYQRGDADHLGRVQRLLDAKIAAATKPRRRGRSRRHAERRVQQEIRQQTVAYYRVLRQYGHTRAEIAELLNLPPRTLRHWDDTCRLQPLTIVPLGRPTARAPVSQRHEVLRFLDDRGPGVGVPTLQECFPDLARAELTALLQRYRRILTARWQESTRVLHWQVPGRVWAMDFAAPTLWGHGDRVTLLDGQCPYLLAVRDLASGYQLCWLPVLAADSATVCAVLARLFRAAGTPLVVKADNGPPFRADGTKRFLENVGVHFLFSPPYWPGYNGAIEAAIGSLKKRTEEHAARQGQAGCWTWADTQAACQQANASQPRRLHGLTPAAAWASRTAVTDLERVCFELAVERQRYLARTEMKLEQELELDHWQGSALDRKAIERALGEHDYLLFRGRRVPLTIRPGKVTFLV